MALKLIPGVGEQLDKLLNGDAEEAHAFIANIYESLGAILDANRQAGYGLVRSNGTDSGRANNGVRPDGEREEYTTRPLVTPVPEAIQNS
jgi:hypothetical protein